MSLGGESAGPSGDVAAADLPISTGGGLSYEPGVGISFAVNPNAPSMPDITYAAQQALMGGVPSGSTSMGGAYYSTPQATSASPVAAGRLTDPTFVAQQALLKGAAKARPQYQPLLTPDNYKDFYKDQSYADTSSAQRAVPNYLPEPSAEAAMAPADNSVMAGGGSFDDAPGDSEWSGLTDTEKAAWYAENPTWGAIARAGNKAFSYSPYSLMQDYFTPGTAIRSDAIAAGIDPTGWDFGTRNNDGLFGTTIGGTISYDFSPENMSMYAFPSVPSYGFQPGRGPSAPSAPSVPDYSIGTSQASAPSQTGGYVVDGSGRAVQSGSGGLVGWGDTPGTAGGNTGMSDADYGDGLI